jgi:hypothetical protein
MKRRINKIYTLFITLLFAVLFVNFSGNPPNGNTGAPGDSLCTGCHNNSNPNGFVATVDVLNFPSTITPNTTYNLTAEVVYTSGTPVRAGFQAVVLDASNNNSGDLSTTDPNVVATTAGIREYVEHDPAQTFGTGTSVTYDFDWVAPNATNGEVITIYIASLVGNGGNGNSGDLTITNSISGTIDAGGSPPLISATSTEVSCFGGNDGTATAQGSGGTPGYTYAWSNGGSGATISNLTVGNYTVTVTDAGALTATTTTMVEQPSQLSLLLINQINVDCFGNSTGLASVNGLGGTAGYTYAWSNGIPGATNSNLPAGTYTATVTDGNLCTSTEVVTITQPPAISLLATSTNVTCNGDNNGTASAFGNGGDGGFSYAWSNGMFGQTISNLAPGTYTITATDGNNCTQTESTSITQPNAINLITTSTNINCNGDNNGTASAFGSGGGSDFSYAWSNGLNGQTISNLGSGTYTVTATDTNNCSEVQAVNVVEPSAITVNILPTNISCNGANDASATALGNGGTGGFTYTWSNGMSGQTISNLGSGTYTATATDANNCTQTQSVSFTEPSAISVIISPTNLSCNGTNDGAASAFGSGGAGGFSYTWSNGMNGQTISNLSAGTYTATATDANNCTQTESINISEPSPVVVNISQNNILCNGENNGSASANGNGGTGNIAYNWSNGMNGANISNLAAGTYTVTVTDANNCTRTESVTISEPPAIIVTISQNNVLCNGENNGSATASGSGGASGFSYLWSNGMSGTTISNLTVGTYTVTATDANNCTQIESVTIIEPNIIVVNISPTNILCNGGNNGSATANGNGGTGNLTYAWSNGIGGATISNLTPGTYTVTSTDANNCTQMESVTITESSPITLNIFSNEISCRNDNDGSATASGNGGAGNFTYSWSNGMSGATISNLGAGTYTVSATDANDCVQTETVTITNPFVISLSISQNNIDCFGNNNGSATASGNGGTGNLTYTWSNGTSGTSISNLTAGTYTASATDANNCIQTETVTITEPNAINISTVQIDINCFGNSNGSASANGSGGTGNLTYAWSNGTSGENISNLTAGTYTLTVTDSNNCTATESVTINQPSNLIANASATGETSAGANDGMATAAPIGGNLGYTFLWSTGSSNQNISNLSPGSYTVTITDNNMCTAVETVIVSSFNCAISINVATTNALCFGETGSATASAQNETDPVTYLWSNGEMTATISNLTPAINYSVTVTDANNCPASMSISISQPAQLQITASTTDVSCNGLSDGSVIINVTGGTPPYSSTLPNGDGNNLSVGIYTASVLDGNNCLIDLNFEITEPPVISPNATATAVTANGANDGSATSNPTGGVGNFTFLWSNGMTTSMINNLAPGNYTVTATDINNCSSNQTVIVNDISCAIAISTTSSNLLCFGNSNGMASVAVNTGTAPFSYLWSNGATSETISNLTTGDYTVTVTDSNNCPVSETVTITQPDLLVLSESVQSILQLNCFENNNGVAAIEVTGGASGNTFNWSNGMMGNPISNLPVGTFTGTVTDANGCFETINFTITQPDELITNATATDETAANANDGTATVSPTGGTGTFNYLWSTGAITASISTLAPGTYTVTTTDANNCESIESVEVNAFDCSLTAAISTTAATCSDATNGAATVTPSGGQNFTYTWSSGGNLPTEINLLPGTYTVTINDASNCALIETITILVLDNIPPTIVAQNISVSLDGNGNATIIPSMIDNGSFDNCGGVTLDINMTSFDCDDLGENTVTLLVSDLAGNPISATATVTVLDEIPPTISCPTNIVIDDCTGLVTYGAPTFSDNCSTPILTFMGPASGTIFPIGETVITMIATDQSGNMSSCTFTVTIDHVLELNATSTDSPCASDDLGTATANATGTSATFDYIWSNNETTPNIMNLSPNTYTVTVTDDSGCTSTSEIVVTEPDALEIILDNVSNEIDLGTNNGAIEVSINGGVGPFDYNWTLNGNTISTDEDPTGLAGGIYILTIIDQNGCTITSAEITVDTIVDNENLILEKNIHLFPNPATDQLFLDFDLPTNFDFNISIHDGIGNVLLGKNATNISNQKLGLEVSNLASGLYFVKIQTGSQIWIRKFIIQN